LLPDAVQTAAVLEANVTGNPELAVALRAKGADPSVRLLGAVNVIV
jgi:hypothetical protein